MKKVGRSYSSHSKNARRSLLDMQGFFELVIMLRGKKAFIPRGVHKFRSFEEAQSWSLRMMTRANR
jgi:hypothetical protein